MRKIIFSCALVCALLFIVACGGSNNTDSRTINHFLQAFEDGGFDTSNRQTPFFQMIGANDGIQFIIDNEFHSIYSFSSESALIEAFENHPFMATQGWVTNGRFVIETNVNEVREFFLNIE